MTRVLIFNLLVFDYFYILTFSLILSLGSHLTKIVTNVSLEKLYDSEGFDTERKCIWLFLFLSFACDP